MSRFTNISVPIAANKFEKLIRRSQADSADALECPSCGQKHLGTAGASDIFGARANGMRPRAPRCLPAAGDGGGNLWNVRDELIRAIVGCHDRVLRSASVM